MPSPDASSLPPASPWRTRLTEWAAILCVWTLFVALIVGRVFLDPDRAGSSPEPQAAEIIGRVSFYFGWALVTPVIFWLCEHLGTNADRPAWQRIGMHVLAALGVSILFDAYSDILFGYALNLRDTAPPASVWASLQGSMQDAMTLGFIYELIIYIMILAVGFARAYYRRLQQRQMQAAQLRAQLTEARLSALRMQINPHFLFNTLNAVSSLVERDPKGVRRMVARLSALLRHTLAQGDQQEVTLASELRVLDDYLEVMRVRFRDRLNVQHDVSDDVRQALVPDMILQPIVENAIKHGVAPQEDGGTVCICARRQGPYLVLRVQDDGPGLDATGNGAPGGDGAVWGSDSGNGIGLQNVRERLEQLYESKHRLSLRSSPSGGLVVEIWIPFHEEESVHPAPKLSVSESGAEAGVLS